MALATAAELRAFAAPAMKADRDAELTRDIAAAQALLDRFLGRSMESSGAVKTVYFDGSSAGDPARDIIEFPSADRPIIHSGPDLVVITEDGVTLVVASGYSTTADVVLYHVNENRRARARRRIGGWSSGVQNVSLAYKTGWTSATVDPAAKQAILEVAWLFFQSPHAIGRQQLDAAGRTAIYNLKLSPVARMALDGLRVW